MKLIHATHRKNLLSIKSRGLLRRFAKMKRKAVWAVPAHREGQAIRHALNKKGWDYLDVILFDVEVPDDWCRAHGDGSFYVDRDIPVSMLTRCRGLFMGEV